MSTLTTIKIQPVFLTNNTAHVDVSEHVKGTEMEYTCASGDNASITVTNGIVQITGRYRANAYNVEVIGRKNDGNDVIRVIIPVEEDAEQSFLIDGGLQNMGDVVLVNAEPMLFELSDYFTSINNYEYALSTTVPNSVVQLQGSALTIVGAYRNMSYTMTVNAYNVSGSITSSFDVREYPPKPFQAKTFVVQDVKANSASTMVLDTRGKVRVITGIEFEIVDGINEVVVRTAVGLNSYYAITMSNQLYAWGTTLVVGNPVAPTIVKQGSLRDVAILEISALSDHVLVLDSLNRLHAWGSNTYGQLGDGSTNNSTLPVIINTGSIVSKRCTQVAVGNGFSIVIDIEGKLHAWGKNDYGQLGQGNTTNLRIPTIVNGGSLSGAVISKVICGDTYFIALDINGKVHGCGNNNYNQMGRSGVQYSTSPVLIDILYVVSKIITSSGSVSALDVEGRIHSWGLNGHGQIGNGNTTNQVIPVHINTGSLQNKVIRNFSKGFRTSYAMDADSNLHVWGDNTSGQFMLPVPSTSTVPVLNDKIQLLTINIASGTETLKLSDYIRFVTQYTIHANPYNSASKDGDNVLTIKGKSLNKTYDVVIQGSNENGFIHFPIRVIEAPFYYAILDMYIESVLSSRPLVFNTQIELKYTDTGARYISIDGTNSATTPLISVDYSKGWSVEIKFRITQISDGKRALFDTPVGTLYIDNSVYVAFAIANQTYFRESININVWNTVIVRNNGHIFMNNSVLDPNPSTIPPPGVMNGVYTLGPSTLSQIFRPPPPCDVQYIRVYNTSDMYKIVFASLQTEEDKSISILNFWLDYQHIKNRYGTNTWIYCKAMSVLDNKLLNYAFFINRVSAERNNADNAYVGLKYSANNGINWYNIRLGDLLTNTSIQDKYTNSTTIYTYVPAAGLGVNGTV